MSFREVNSLRKEGRLDEALRLAQQDLHEEQSEWTYSALFWVLRDYCNLYLSQGNRKDALNMFQQLENVFGEMDDNGGYAQRAVTALQRQLTPFGDEVNRLSEQSKEDGQEETAYNEICQLHRENPLSDYLHETIGWIIYRYLKKNYLSCGSLDARKALHTYLELHNERPSMLHSQMLNIATFISEKYEDFKFLPFLELWDVTTLSNDDFQPSVWNEKEYSPLVERIIERCFRMGYGLEETKVAFTKDERISEELIYSLYSKNQFFIINSSRSDGDNAFFANVEKYNSSIRGLSISNEYHSRILSLYLWKLPDESIANAISVIEDWGLDNFRPEDWQREKTDDTEYPSLVEKAVKHYFSALETIHFRKIDERFEPLLRKACLEFDDDQLDRDLAILMMAMGRHEEALSIYRSLLLSLNRFYVWKELAEATSDTELKISAYCKAIISEPNDDYLGEVHLELARILIGNKMFGEAKRELLTYSETYRQNGWRIKDEFYAILSQIPTDAIPADSNDSFYKSHLESAEEFVYSEIEWTTMFVADVYSPKDKKVKRAKLVSADGLAISINYKKLGKTDNNNIIGRCFDVKIHSDNDRKEIVLIKESALQLQQLLSPVMCCVDYHNKQRQCYHLVSENGKEMVLSNTTIKLREGAFCRCYAIPESNAPSSGDACSRALFCDMVDKASAIAHFPKKVGVVDGVNEIKELFHCVFGTHDDIIIKYSQTGIRPKVGDYLSVRYYQKRNKEGRVFRRMIEVKIIDDCEKKLSKTATGPIRMNYNNKGQIFGFVEDYYVPGNLLVGVEDDDLVVVNVVFDGEKWKAYSLKKT